MTLENIKKNVYQNHLYEALWNKKLLNDNMILLGLGGSYAYGTNIETSDIDIRGVAVNTKKEILLGDDFQTYSSNATDTVIHSFKKFMKLLANSSPNAIEILGLEPKHFIYMTSVGDEIMRNKEMFLSKELAVSFTNFAHDQLKAANKCLANVQYGDKINKPLMNAIRAELMCCEILEDGVLSTDKTIHREMLLAIRNGDAYFLTEHGPNERYINVYLGLEERIAKAKKYSYLPDTPDYDAIEKFTLDINEQIVTDSLNRDNLITLNNSLEDFTFERE